MDLILPCPSSTHDIQGKIEARELPNRRWATKQITMQLSFIHETSIYLIFRDHEKWINFTFFSHKRLPFPPSFFNGTISYSQLSNYTFDYDFPAGDKINITAEFIGSKTQSVLGIVSNCGSESGRELIIDRLRKQMSLTLHGRCYGDKISNDDLQRLIKSHRFILALENKMCPEYVTEKGFRYKELIVPIVFSRRFVGNVLPSDSFIAIDDFNSTEELKEHLERLQNDDEEYLKYFAWIERKENREVRDKGVCKLCTDLHMIPRSHHSSLHRASFPDENMCIAP
ncbi:hypothetical protein PRIPAC_88286 [Pristionchus pacificus]|uniref:Fucosyltransferase n=1 Tax=Pristionchus pacificus TaxID=54126 RepID=A0A2A6B7Z2_PRIPA|nr:hypothetical protein PRIPAC_88286 [Pristionchus pacificus]|eukprot:PDM61985.1 hypothetical protein PRIPAC_51427 [Pristionchus pacificus]